MILFLTNADTELLCLRVVAEALPATLGLRATNPERLEEEPSLDGVDVVVVRLLGGRRSWEEPFDRLRAACAQRSVSLLAFGGEAWLDRELAAASSVPLGTLVAGFEYLVQGGPSNLEQFVRFVSDQVLGTALGHQPASVVPECGVYSEGTVEAGRPTVAVVFYRAHLVSGNTRFVDELCRGIEAAGANVIAVYCYSLRARDGEDTHPAIEILRAARVDAVVTTVLAAGAMAESLDCWDPGTLATLDVPVIQAISATSDARSWADAPMGLSPLDVAMSVAIPEFDGRVISVPFSFKEQVDDGDGLGTSVSAYRTLPDRVSRVAGLAVAMARLRSIPVAQRRVALVLSAYPTKRSRLGNAVGLDTPASVLVLLAAMARAGYTVGPAPQSGDELMAQLADGLVYGEGAAPPAAAVGRLRVADYQEWYGGLPEEARRAIEEHWGPPPGTVSVDHQDGSFVFSGLSFGAVVAAVQPPRGFGENPVAVYHSPDLPPTHHYLAFYRWLREGFGAHAVVHVGKHGTLEWLPGKGVGLSGSCFPDAALGDLPLVYPFVVNDPGEGTQAKRRTHAVIVDHLVPPLTRADSYDDVARLEELLDRHAQLASLDPTKLPAIRAQVWEALVAAEIHRDLGLPGAPGGDRFDDPAFDDLLVEVDGYLCELKDAQIRGGLHVLGKAPQGQDELDMVAAITRLDQGGVGSLRTEVAAALGLGAPEGLSRRDTDRLEAECQRRLERCQRHGWDLGAAVAAGAPDTVVLRWVCDRLVPALHATSDEIDGVLGALDGRFIAPGPSGAPSRGMANVLPTGRNFYALDPRAVPSRLAWDVGRRLADRLLERHHAEEGRYPASIGLVVWGTSAMRTGGDDIAEALALLGVRPVWAEGSGRVEGLELIGAAELGRPRVDVTLRVSGFFRDAFPHVLDLLDRAVRLAAAADDGAPNPVAAAGADEPRVFGPRPGAYGSGILALLESGQWEDDQDLASVYVAWGGWAYGAGGVARPAEEAFARRLARIEIAVKNQDNREHDIFDSDDYLQDHGGMVAAVRALSGRQPKAFFGDSANPERPRVRSLAEEAARVVRTRVLNPKWLGAMERHGYKGAFEMAATVDYLFGYDATAGVLEDWMYERVTATYVGDAARRKFFAESNPWALRAIAERLLEAVERGLWSPTSEALSTLRSAILEGEGLEEER